MWLEDVPDELRVLNFVEKLLVSRYRHNVCVVQVSKGQRKMTANAIVFAQPVAKFYSILPPPPADIGDCLVVMFTGPSGPTPADFERTPFVIRRKVVYRALEWLKKNHRDYHDLIISQENLQAYPEDSPPVAVITRKETEGNVPAENIPVNASSSEELGTEDGPCTFAVDGLSSKKWNTYDTKTKIVEAIKHIQEGNPVIAYGHSSDPESIYGNPQLYPDMFPWLFPYGFGGFANDLMLKPVARRTHIQSLLMYYDRRFQMDEYFPFLVFNQDQIKSASCGGYLLTERKNFDHIADRILSLNRSALSRLIDKGKELGYLLPETDDERACFEMTTLIQHVAGHVAGSNAQKQYQRNEMHSLMFEKGTPAFFITFAPVDFKSPICLYYCGQKVDLSALCPSNESNQQRLNAIANNPVACA